MEEQPDLLAEYLAYGNPNREQTLHIFQRNKADMNKANVVDSDKYFHSKANCEAGQYGRILQPLLYDAGKEVYDVFTKTIYPRNDKPFYIDLYDSIGDINADLYGLSNGLLNRQINCSKQENKYKVKGLEKY